MFIDVKLLSGFSKPLTYHVPADWPSISVGTVVRVPLRKKTVVAQVVALYQELSKTQLYEIKDAVRIEPLPRDQNYLPFIKGLSTYNQVEELYALQRLQTFLQEKEHEEPALTAEQQEERKSTTLTAEQQEIVDALTPTITTPIYQATVIHGVTGSGKTEVYKKLITHAFKEGKTTILLLPEVSLAVQFERILSAAFGETIPLYSFHSATKTSKKKQLWERLLQGLPSLIIGVHLPIFLPISNLGLIIVDEEHEVGFQEKKHPKINTKQAALLRARAYGIPIVLGSATPSLSSLYNVTHRGWKLFSLKKRFAGVFPTVRVVSLLDKKERKQFWISQELLQALKNCLAKKEQAIIFLNRRGVCFFMQCADCSFIFCCTSCSVSLTLHADDTLRCHYCSYQRPMPTECSSCKGASFLRKGIGTEQLVTILKKILPFARIGRADLDVSSNKKMWAQTITAFEQQEIDILVGTQTIAKGYHFPKVTLVGVIWADINLNFPFYNAQETTLQQLIQVAGRAGRQTNDSLVIIQTMTDQSIFNYLNETTYPAFYEQEIEKRREVGYPPIIRFAEIELKHTKEQIVDQEAAAVACFLMNLKFSMRVLGPTKPPVAQIKKVFSRKIYLKADSFELLQKAFAALEKKRYKSHIFYTPDPSN